MEEGSRQPGSAPALGWDPSDVPWVPDTSRHRCPSWLPSQDPLPSWPLLPWVLPLPAPPSIPLHPPPPPAPSPTAAPQGLWPRGSICRSVCTGPASVSAAVTLLSVFLLSVLLPGFPVSSEPQARRTEEGRRAGQLLAVGRAGRGAPALTPQRSQGAPGSGSSNQGPGPGCAREHTDAACTGHECAW